MLYQLSYLGAKLGPNRLGKQSARVIEAGFHAVQNTRSGKNPGQTRALNPDLDAKT
jgi:hypothetical protein